ncbi:MAG: molybdopterin-dependent oxidoreductase [Pirellulales bacterium]
MTEFTIDRRGFLISSAAVSWGALVSVGGAGWAVRARGAGAGESSLIVHSESPLNGEPAAADLVREWITPTKLFYVRNHGPTPALDAATFRVRVSGLVENELELSVGELGEKFPASSRVATLICAGCRRSELNDEKPIAGVPWGVGAIGNAAWSGVSLADVLRLAGVKEGAKHVWFESVDRVEKDGHAFAFGASIPLEKALGDPRSGLGPLLATEMNGQSLEPSHGFPLRAVVPGFIGARSVKWLGKIVVSDRPNPNYFMTTAYKMVADSGAAQQQTQTQTQTDPICEFPINAAICASETGRGGGAKRVAVRGYALPSGYAERTIARVEVSSDGGATWWTADLEEPSRPFCWRLWKAEVPIPAMTKELIARATDSAGVTQPERARWNAGGYLCNAWHRVPVEQHEGM